jgi:MFS family permease
MNGSAVMERPAQAPSLWRNFQFQVLWIGQSASTLGTSVADVAYPLAILASTGSPARAGLFAAAQAAGALAAGLPGGQLADRHEWRRIVVVTEAARAAVTALVAAALILGLLSLPVLLAAAVLLGVGQSVGGAARYLLVRSVVPDEQLTAALTQDEVRLNGAALAGPPLGGVLYGIRALAHTVPFLFTAASFIVALATALLIRSGPRDGEPVRRSEDREGSEPAESLAGDTGLATDQPASAAASRNRSGSGLLAGLGVLWGRPVLRATALLIMIVNTIGVGLELVVVVILRDQAVSPSMIGLALGGGAVGGLVGAPLVPVLHRLRPGILLLAVGLLLIPTFALLAVPAGPWWAAGVLFVAMLGVPSIRVLLDILVFRQVPTGQRGRVIGALMTLMGLGMPIGLAGAGLLLQYLSAPAVMLVLAGVLAAGVLGCATMRPLWQARWPT